MDKTLDAILQVALTGIDPKATAAAMADRLMEVSAADRVQVLAKLIDDASRFAMMRDRNHTGIPNNLTRTLTSTLERHVEMGPTDAYAQRDLLHRLGFALASSIEEGHFYAVSIDRRVTPPDSYGPTWRQRLEVITLRVTITPLTGGRVREDVKPP